VQPNDDLIRHYIITGSKNALKDCTLLKSISGVSVSISATNRCNLEAKMDIYFHHGMLLTRIY
jgi:hypothetical protein